MTTIGNCQLIRVVIGVEEVTQQEDRTTLLDGVRHELYSLSHIGLLTFRFESQQFSNNKENVLSALLRRNELLHPVRKEDDPNFVVVLNGRKRQGGSNLREQVTLSLILCAKVQRT